MGSGKSSFGKKLAKLLNVPFVDTDREISRLHGPIVDIFAAHGESYFRDLESTTLEKAVMSAGVIATGGGAVLRLANQRLLGNCFVIYLRTNFESVKGRLDTERRPLLADNPDAWQQIFEDRKHIYEELADAIVDTSGRHADTIIAELRELSENSK